MQLYIIVSLNFRNIVKYGFIFVLPTALLPCSWNQPIWWCSLCWISWASKVVYVSYYVYITIHSVDFGIRKTKQHRTKQTNEKKKTGTTTARETNYLWAYLEIFLSQKNINCVPCTKNWLCIFCCEVWCIFTLLSKMWCCSGDCHKVITARAIDTVLPESRAKRINLATLSVLWSDYKYANWSNFTFFLGRRGLGCVVCGKGDGDWGL